MRKFISWEIFLILYAIFVFSHCLLFSSQPPYILGSDLKGFLTGASILKSGKVNQLYHLEAQEHFQAEILRPYKSYIRGLQPLFLPFRELPLTGFLFIPLTKVSFFSAYWTMSLINFSILFLFYFLSISFFPQLKKEKSLLWLPFLFWPSVQLIEVGQYVSVLALLFLLVYQATKKENFFLAGILSGFLFPKPQLLTFFPFYFLLVRKKIEFIKGFLISFGGVILLNLFLVDLGIMLRYPKFLFQTEGPAFGSHPQYMFSLYPLLSSLPLLAKISPVWLLVINGGFYLWTLIYFKSKIEKISFDYLFSAAILFSIVYSIHANLHNLVIFLVPIFIFLKMMAGTKKKALRNFLRKMVLILFLLPLAPLFTKIALGSAIILLAGLYLLGGRRGRHDASRLFFFIRNFSSPHDTQV